MKPELKGNVLVCTYYDTEYDVAMNKAEDACGVSGDDVITIITFPANSKLAAFYMGCRTASLNHRRPKGVDRMGREAYTDEQKTKMATQGGQK